MVQRHTTREEQELAEALAPECTYYDWRGTSAACISPVPDHPAYRSPFADYMRNRSKYMDSDTSERTRMSFYLPKFPARISADLAVRHKISFSRFITFISEIGLITLQIDYHDQYQTLKSARQTMVPLIRTEQDRSLYMQLDKHNVSLGSCAGNRGGSSTHFSPSVPEWLYNAIADAGVYLNMTQSDVVYLCWCIGMKYSIDDRYKSPLLMKDVEAVITGFEYDLGYSAKITENVLQNLSNVTTISTIEHI